VARSGGLLEWAGGICHACGPAVAVVFAWDGRRLRDVTRSNPQYALDTANSYRRQILKGQFYSNDYAVGAAMGYYANMAQIGRGPYARRWLKRHVSNKQYEWLEETIPDIDKQLAKIPGMVWTTKDVSIQAPSS